MKIGILADLHFGYGYNTSFENDCFDAAKEAIEKCCECDLILICGDIFDTRNPKPSTLAKALDILVRPLIKKSDVKLVETDLKMKEITKRVLEGIPILAIHGNHERRVGREENPIQTLENAGILIYLNKNYIVFEKDGRKVCIQGMGNVSERFALEEIKKWNPKPKKDCFNILMIHQNIEDYVYSPNEPSILKFEDLPKGFDLIINGHIHIHSLDNYGNSKILIPGSLIYTQLEKNEAESKKGFYIVDIGNAIKIDFIEIKNSRKFYYDEIKLYPNQSLKEVVESRIRKFLNFKDKKEPIIKIKVYGKEDEISDSDIREIEKKYGNEAIIYISKFIEDSKIGEKAEILRNLREKRLSIEEIGMNILKNNLNELKYEGYDFEALFRILSEGEIDTIMNILLEKQTTLKL